MAGNTESVFMSFFIMYIHDHIFLHVLHPHKYESMDNTAPAAVVLTYFHRNIPISAQKGSYQAKFCISVYT